jgi:hypothetical protein
MAYYKISQHTIYIKLAIDLPSNHTSRKTGRLSPWTPWMTPEHVRGQNPKCPAAGVELEEA